MQHCRVRSIRSVRAVPRHFPHDFQDRWRVSPPAAGEANGVRKVAGETVSEAEVMFSVVEG